MRILLTGASGLVGRTLGPGLAAAGHEAVPLVRRRSGASPAAGAVWWDPASGELDREGLAGFDAVIHLAGENIAGGRWTAARKQRILDSRVRGTGLLAGALAGQDRPPSVLIAASAVGFYGNRPPQEQVTEASPPGSGFLADVCRQWEAAAAPAAEAGIRVVNLRLGVVLHPEDGALARMLTPFRLGLGGPVGSGKQMMSWIAAAELPPLVLHLLGNPGITGPVNAVAPNPVDNAGFGRTLGRVLSRPAVAPLPAFAARLLFGEMADELLLGGVAAQPQVLLDSGYTFKHPTLEPALRELLGQ